MSDTKDVQKLRAEAQKIPVTVNVGKNGITDATVDELDRHLKKDKLVKVRLLPASTQDASLQDQAQQLAERTRSRLVETRGSTAVFWRG